MELVEAKKAKVVLLRVSTTEAISLIHSLTQQILEQSPNSGRLETYLTDGRDFSIAVHHAPLERVPSGGIW